jgi:hypothetical protein
MTRKEELEETTVDLLETLIIVGQKLLQFADKNRIEFPERETLIHLLIRAKSLVADISLSEPSLRLISDACIHPKSSDEDYNSTSLGALVTCRDSVLGVNYRNSMLQGLY